MVRHFQRTRDLGQVMKISGHRDVETALGYLRSTAELPAVKGSLEADTLLAAVTENGSSTSETLARHNLENLARNVLAAAPQLTPLKPLKLA